MTARSAFLPDAIGDYVATHSTPPTPIEQDLIDTTQQMEAAAMQIGPVQARFMATLVRALQPRVIVEVGTFTGYSALAMAAELGEGARIIACDLSESWTAIGREHWDRAGVGDRIELHLGPAAASLAALPDDLQVDLAFIDADKTGYLGYLEQLVPHLGPQSVVLVDNVLWDGHVVDDEDLSTDTVALREFNRTVASDPRFDVAMLPVGDGISMITLRPSR